MTSYLNKKSARLFIQEIWKIIFQ